MIALLLMTLIFIGALVGMNKLIDVEKIKNNWPEYRCRPDVMVTAGLYGHNASENIEFCLNNGFKQRATAAMGPFYSFLAMFVNILMTLLKSINSIRLIFATIVGSVTKIFSEFSERIKAFFYRIQATGMRMKWLMGRVVASIYSVLFMGMSGMKAMTNFSNTFLFKFLDTFCFDPNTRISTARGVLSIREVVIGDVLEDGSRVTGTFSFDSDGQDMVTLPRPNGQPILVSTNHYMQYNGKWIHTADHPDARPAEPWSGGTKDPLICLNTDTHTFVIGDYVFRDYDETEEGDAETMQHVLSQLNGKTAPITSVKEYNCCFAGNTQVATPSGPVSAKDIVLGQAFAQGHVCGIVKKEVTQVCEIDGTLYAPGTAIWVEKEQCWKRAGDAAPTVPCTPTPFYSFVVTPGACIPLVNGTIVRDYVEVHSPDTEQAYSITLEH